MDVIGRLIAAVNSSGLKHARIAADARMNSSKFSKIVNRRQVPTVLEFLDILAAIQLEPARIFTEGELVVETEELRAAYAASSDVRDRVERLTASLERLLPVVASPLGSIRATPKRLRANLVAPVSAAANPNADLLVQMETERKRIPRRAWLRGARMIARVVGDSMDGGSDPIADGELAYLKPTRSARTAQGRAVLVRRDDALFLKVFERSGHTIRLVSTNPDAETIVLDAESENLQIYGFVVDHGHARM